MISLNLSATKTTNGDRSNNTFITSYYNIFWWINIHKSKLFSRNDKTPGCPPPRPPPRSYHPQFIMARGVLHINLGEIELWEIDLDGVHTWALLIFPLGKWMDPGKKAAVSKK